MAVKLSSNKRADTENAAKEAKYLTKILGEDPDKPSPNWDKLIATCVIVPETFNNDVSYGTNKVLTVTHRIRKVEEPE